MQSVLGRAVLFCLFTLRSAVYFSASASAGVQRGTIYCGDKVNGCTPGDNYGLNDQLSAMGAR